MGIKTWILTSFRELFLYHYQSLEFRAKIFALIIAPSCNNVKECDLSTLKNVAADIYKDNEHRQGVLLNIVKEYIAMMLRNPSVSYNEAVKNINREVKTHKALAQKINMEHIRRFLREDIDPEKQVLQQRILEFLEEQSKSI